MSQNPSLEEARRRRLARLGATSSQSPTESDRPRNAVPESKAETPPAPPITMSKGSSGSKRSLSGQAEPPAAPQEKKTPKPSTPAQVDKLLRRSLRVVVGGESCPTNFVQISATDLGGTNQLSASNIGLAIETRIQKEDDVMVFLSDLYSRLRDEARAAKNRGDDPGNEALTAGFQQAAKIAAHRVESQVKCRDEIIAALLCGISGKKIKPEFCRAVLGLVTNTSVVVKALAEAGAEAMRGKLISQPNIGSQNPAIPRPPLEIADELVSAAAMRGFAEAIQYLGKARAGPILTELPLFQKPPLSSAENTDNNAQAQEVINQLQGGLGGLFRAMAQAAGRSQGRDLERTTALGLACRAGDYTGNLALIQEIAGLLKRTQRNGLEPRLADLSNRIKALRGALDVLFSTLVKASGSSRDAVLQWIAALLARSADAEATVRDHRNIPSQATRLNACSTCLKLCRPVLDKPEREQNCRNDIYFIENSTLGKAAFANGEVTRIYARGSTPDDEDVVMTDQKDEDSDAEMYDDDLKAALAMSMDGVIQPEEEYNFITILFFLTLRALRLGLVVEMSRHQDEQDQLHHFMRRVGLDDERVHLAAAMGLATETTVFDSDTLHDALRFSAWTSRWLLALAEDEFKKVPEHILEDVALIVTLICRFRPEVLRGVEPLAPYLQLAIRCLSQREKLVRSPHLRDKLLQGIYECFIPIASQSDVFARPRGGLIRLFLMRGGAVKDDATYASAEKNVSLLLDPPACIQNANLLAPAILWMFGDAEHLGFYDVTPARLRIAALIRQLWTSSFHKVAFRNIATDEEAFVTFANGLLNETNRLVADAIEKLPQIRDHQVRTGILSVNPTTEPELAALRDEYQNADQARREELDQRFDDLDRHLGLDLRLCTETLGLVELLTTDETVSGAFILPQLRSRLAAMLLSVMRSFTGRRSLNIKIHNPQKYGFDPRDILTRVGRVATQFAKRFSQLEGGKGASSQFALALADSGYFDPHLLTKTAQTLRKINTLDPKDIDALDTLAKNANDAYQTLQSEAGLEEIAPDNYVDPLTCALMTNPVKLPSGYICDSATIKQHLLNERSDPFTRQALEETHLIPLPQLGQEIQAWIQEQRENRRQQRLDLAPTQESS
mmetsp:Transcript_6081/g.9013  ORF Transcript_6081/g.9013 Transcript_6081/m.9013 type:complete len:1130 (+) Transcript_6081:87-3476(+)|eukprot:CAMPEP_0197314612 /NCGR_PEP_ID=MMETSP0891-20130614/34851_1 /TAXON_ID=44058 ORGANISM="Aureoumbra lagunensis, Strain CCMP1510" /NCGR_SAMPLE_ID=MMETSP0891 /ASSEMBLY_ACC=CAM_ASM_000534 /LENGTH=1129 /DNA_ID=CAMNT_0042803155 /DNA_START=63 /DNA_END=3452 /DNA_ORIENTATION=+